MAVRKIRIIARHLAYPRTAHEHVTAYELELPSGFVWCANEQRRRVVSKWQAVKWAMEEGSYTHKEADGSSSPVQPEFYVDNGGRSVTASVRHHSGPGLKTASTGWLQTSDDHYWYDNILALPDCAEE